MRLYVKKLEAHVNSRIEVGMQLVCVRVARVRHSCHMGLNAVSLDHAWATRAWALPCFPCLPRRPATSGTRSSWSC